MASHERMFSLEHADRLDNPERLTWLPHDEVLSHLSLGPGLVVADVGAGTGYFALPLATAVSPGGKVLAVDLQPELLRRLRARIPSGVDIDLLEADAARMPIDPSTVDLVFCANLWHEVDDAGTTLVEFARVLRPEGRLVIVDWRVDVDQPPGPPVAHRLSSSRVVGQLRERKWREMAVCDVGVYSYLVAAQRPSG
jgi:ubiquinone/menaquinone biosynthesis C-methylase UbiE